MSNFAIFSEFCERVAVYRSQINSIDELKLAAFDAALQSLYRLRDHYEKPQPQTPIYWLLTRAHATLLPFDLPDLDEYILQSVIPKINDIKQMMTEHLNKTVEVEVGRLYFSAHHPERKAALIAFLDEHVYQVGFSRNFIYMLLCRLKHRYFDEKCATFCDVESYMQVISHFKPQRFSAGSYEVILTVTHLYNNHRQSNAHPYSERSLREFEVASLCTRPMSRSLPELSSVNTEEEITKPLANLKLGI